MKKILSLVSVVMFLIILTACTNLSNIDAISLASPLESGIYLNVNQEVDVSVSIVPSDTTNKKLSWEIKDSSILTLLDDGIIKGVKIGETKLIITSKSNPVVFIEINVYVVDKVWPSDEIKAFGGFDLPEFGDYAFVEVNQSEEELTLKIKGTTSNPSDEVIMYKDLLVSAGWVVVSYDNHTGTLTNPNNNFTINMHNQYLHDGNTIEFNISLSSDVKDDHNHDH